MDSRPNHKNKVAFSNLSSIGNNMVAVSTQQTPDLETKVLCTNPYITGLSLSFEVVDCTRKIGIGHKIKIASHGWG